MPGLRAEECEPLPEADWCIPFMLYYFISRLNQRRRVIGLFWGRVGYFFGVGKKLGVSFVTER